MSWTQFGESMLSTLARKQLSGLLWWHRRKQAFWAWSFSMRLAFFLPRRKQQIWWILMDFNGCSIFATSTLMAVLPKGFSASGASVFISPVNCLCMPATSENLIIVHQGLYVHRCLYHNYILVAKVRTWPHLGNIATQHVCKKPQAHSCSLKLLNWDANKSWIRAVPFLLVSSFGSLVCFPEGIAIWHAFWVMPVFSLSSFKINREQLRPTRCWANQLDFLGFSSSSSAFGVDKAWREELEK